MRHLTSLFDVTSAEVRKIIDQALELKSQWSRGQREPLLSGWVLTQVFEKPSLRTRVSFEAAIQQLGGSAIFLSGKDAGLEGREPVEDVARVLGGYSDFIVLRTFSQKLIEDFAKSSGASVVNGLSDDSHPCQALADMMTAEEVFGGLDGLKLAYVGDGNNVAKSLMHACAHLGVEMSIAAPDGYQVADEFAEQIRAALPDFRFSQVADPVVAVANANIVYTDVWASMGQEAEKDLRSQIFAPYQVTRKLLDAAAKDVRLMHCLPARRGLEVTDEVMRDPRSVVFPEAENRMHLAKGLFVWLLEQMNVE